MDVPQVIPDAEWEEFEKFARDFYTKCLLLATEVAGGGENAPTIQILLKELSPDLLTLYEFWKKKTEP